MATKVQETFTKMFIEKIEERRANGENVSAPWRRLWNPAVGADRSLNTGKAYRGSNVFMTAIQGYASPWWATKKQIESFGGSINRQEDGKLVPYTPILWWNFPSDEERANGRYPMCRFYQVWNAEQCTGLEARIEKMSDDEGTSEPVNPIEAAQAIVDGWHGKPVIKVGGGRAYYDPSADTVSVPEIQAFESAEAYYSTLYHELSHATGHRTRLGRDGVINAVRFGSHDYSEEELIAEMSAAMLLGHAGIETPETVENSTAYLDHWLKVMKRDPAMLSTAGSAAQKAVDMVRGIKWEKAEKD